MSILLMFIGVILSVAWLASDGAPAWNCWVVASYAPNYLLPCLTVNKPLWEPLTGFVATVAGLFGLLAEGFGPCRSESKGYYPNEHQLREKRNELIRRIRQHTIVPGLVQSLYQEKLFPFSLENNLAAGPQMHAFFEKQANHQLLILGNAGSGKTTIMLDLANTYLDRAIQEPEIHVPVVVSLSSWQGNKISFKTWLTGEIQRQYGDGIADRVIRYLLDYNEIAPFLDGLDELPEDRRADAVKAIEEYRKSDSPRWLVVCSRCDEYDTLVDKNEGFSSLTVVRTNRSVTVDQVRQYLKELTGEQPKQVMSAIEADEILQNEVANTPLALYVMLEASASVDWAALPTHQGAEIVRAALWNAYIEETLVRKAMTHRSRLSPQYEATKTLKWLKWLAHEMKKHNQTTFLPERMNRSWFEHPWQRNLWIAVAGLLGGMLGLLTGSPRLAFALGSLVSFFAYVGDVDVREHVNIKPSTSRLRGGLLVALMSGLGVAYGIWISTWNSASPSVRIVAAVIGGALFGLPVGLIYVLLEHTGTDYGDNKTSLGTAPNRAIRQSLQNGLLVGSFVGFSFGLVLWFLAGPEAALSGGLLLSLTFGLVYGLDSVIKHYAMRLVFVLDGSMPLRFISFLDYCARHILLRRLGGGYEFIHPTFRDYVADLTSAHIDEIAQAIEKRKAPKSATE